MLPKVSQSPTNDDFVQNPYPFYETCLAKGGKVFWEDYNMVSLFKYDDVSSILKDKRFGRECPEDKKQDYRKELAPFYQLEDHSMLQLEPPKHTRLRGLVLRAFTSRKINSMAEEIKILCTQLMHNFSSKQVNILNEYANKIPVIIIARLLGVPEEMSDQLLRWSNDMVMMYQARRTEKHEERAITASKEFSDFMRSYVDERRSKPEDDLITHLISAEENGEKLTTDELITTCILLLNAGHEATVHSLGNGIKILLENKKMKIDWQNESRISQLIEEILRFDPPLHMFTRYAYEPINIGSYALKKGEEVALVLGATGRDKTLWSDPEYFDPNRIIKKNTAFGGGIHFCVGAALARLE
ncbi:MAG: cytochrome P450, partial [Paracoccaceae bacterium]|nr:cytochrome P450 [Paracoccaceae bacterium]